MNEPKVQRHSDMPIRLTPLFGREQEVRRLCTQLRQSQVRLLTLTGPGGIGKTSLALRVVEEMMSHFADGVCFVPLVAIRDPELVIPTIAQTLKLRETQTLAPFENLKTYLHMKHLLLFLDNFEQVIEAAPVLTSLLETCPALKILVTSREMLHVRSEWEHSVPPLALPDLHHLPAREVLARYAAIALFVQRVLYVKPDFHLTEANAATIATICTRLDGLPLALELAAARLKYLSVQALLARLEHRLEILTQGPRDVHARQQTLYNTIQWSYDLLHVGEQRLLRRLAVFVGGWTLEAAEAVCQIDNDEHLNVFEGITSLLDKSLIYQKEQQDGEHRLFMLETIREYGWECLIATGEAASLQNAHAAYYLTFAEKVASESGGLQEAEWLDQLERDHDNLRAALRWSLERREVDQTSELALRFSDALNWFWMQRGYLSEGRQYLDRILIGSERMVTPLQASLTYSAGRLAFYQDDFRQSEKFTKEALTCFRQLGDKRGMALSLRRLGHLAIIRHNYQAARILIEESVVLLRDVDHKSSLAYSLCLLAPLISEQGEYTRACLLAEEGLTLFKELNDRGPLSHALLYYAEVLFSQGEYARASRIGEEALAIAKEQGLKWRIASSLELLGQIKLHQQGNGTKARSFFEESLRIYRELGNRWSIARLLACLASMATFQGDDAKADLLFEESLAILKNVEDQELLASFLAELAPTVLALGNLTWAAQLWGNAESLREAIGIPLTMDAHVSYHRMLTSTRTKLGETIFATAWSSGRTMTLEQVLSRLDSTTMPPSTSTEASLNASTKNSVPYSAGLTKREGEVLCLLAQGLSDAQVAAKLTLSRRTVNWYLTSIYSKLHVSSRSAATRYALDHHLVSPDQ